MTQGYETPRWQIWLRTGLTWSYLVWCTKQIWDLFENALVPDLMFLTGAGFCMIGFWLGVGSQQRMHEVIDTLRRSGSLSVAERQLPALHGELERIVRSRSRIGSIVVAAAEFTVIMTGFLLVPWLGYGYSPRAFITPADWAVFLAFIVVGTLAGGLIGWMLGAFAGYSQLPAAVRATGGTFLIQPDAGDGYGGLAALVRFTRRQAALTLLPTIWIGLWLILTSLQPFAFLGRWRLPLFLLFGLAVFYSASGFSTPLRRIQDLFRDIEEFAMSHKDRTMLDRIRALRRRIWPAPSSFYVIVALLCGGIAMAGMRLPLQVFVLGWPRV